MVPAKDLGHFVNIPVIKFHKIDEKAKTHQKRNTMRRP